VGASWRISEEQFMENTRQWLDNLTLKVSYGVQGNDNLGTYYAWQGLYDYTWPNATDAGAFVDKLENRKVTWEKNGNLNAGIEATMFGGRLGVSVEYYNRKTRDMLLNSPLPISTGFTGFNDNVGSLRNQGLEVSLRGTILDKRDFRWDATLMGSFNRNKVLSLTGGQDVITSGIRVIEVGRRSTPSTCRKRPASDPATGKQLYYAYWTQTVNDEGTLVNTRCDALHHRQRGDGHLEQILPRKPRAETLRQHRFDVHDPEEHRRLVPDDLFDRRMGLRRTLQRLDVRAVRRQQLAQKRQTPLAEAGRQDRRADARSGRLVRHDQQLAARRLVLRHQEHHRRLHASQALAQEDRHRVAARIYATLDNIAMFNHMDGMDPQYNFTGSVAYSYTPSRVIAFGSV